MFQTLTMPGDDVAEDTDDCPIDDRSRLLATGWPKMAFIENKLADDPTNWWAAIHACVEAMLRSSGLRIEARPGHEIYLCSPDPDSGPTREWYLSQLASATGGARGAG